MNIDLILEMVLGSIFVIMLTTLIIMMVFGVIQEGSDFTAEETKYIGVRAASSFYISAEDGKYGQANPEEIRDKLTTDGGGGPKVALKKDPFKDHHNLNIQTHNLEELNEGLYDTQRITVHSKSENGFYHVYSTVPTFIEESD